MRFVFVRSQRIIRNLEGNLNVIITQPGTSDTSEDNGQGSSTGTEDTSNPGATIPGGLTIPGETSIPSGTTPDPGTSSGDSGSLTDTGLPDWNTGFGSDDETSIENEEKEDPPKQN